MRTQTPVSVQTMLHRPGRPAPLHRGAHADAAKKGTLRLDQAAYTLPPNDLPGITQLHLNENLFTTVQTAVHQLSHAELLETYLATLHSYPTGGVQALQTAIADGLALAPEHVVIGPGSAALLRDLVLYLLKAHATLLLPTPTWSFYHKLVELVGARVETVPLRQEEHAFVYDTRRIAAKIEACAPNVVLLCSPNNPTGNLLPLADLLWLVRTYPAVDFILDEAYYGFHTAYTAAQEKELLAHTARPNLFVLRTFSKFYGLANLRLGFLLCSAANARHLQHLAPAFGLPSLNQMVAVQRFTDQPFQTALRQEYAAVNAYMFAALKQIPGLTPYQTFANFILVQHTADWGALDERVLHYGYKVKRETINGASHYLRITYAAMPTMQALIKVLWHLAPQE